MQSRSAQKVETRVSAKGYCKAVIANTRTPTLVELTGLRPRSSPWQRDSRWDNRIIDAVTTEQALTLH